LLSGVTVGELLVESAPVVNTIVKVHSVTILADRQDRVNNGALRMAEAVVGDATGCINMKVNERS
jgi:hypothetical protein